MMKEKAEDISPLTAELKKRFEELPNGIIELEEAIQSEKTQADMFYQTNPQILDDYQKRKREIEALESDLSKEQSQLEFVSNKIIALRNQWLPKLEELIARIHQSFSAHFEKINCQGVISLAKPEEDDYEHFGLHIAIKFRDGDKLRVLDPRIQSGGERSVTTMLFLISLQDLTSCPFRLVDEINQGMDPVNERMIFKIIVNAACRPKLPQYFLITPKLLPDLKFTEKMTVLCVFNGPWQLKQKDWEFEKEFEKSGQPNGIASH